MNTQIINSMMNFTGKTVLITGGNGILGSEIAWNLHEVGANIIILDRNKNLPNEILDRLDNKDTNYQAIEVDVLNRESLEKAREITMNKFGRIDYLINTAGGNHPSATTTEDRSFFNLPKEALQFTLDLNLLGTFLPCQVFGEVMCDQKKGAIINISSMAADRPLTRIPAYAATKAGISNFTKWLAVYMAQEYSTEIRVNAIAPGFFLTRQNKFLLLDKDEKTLTTRGEKIIEHTPMNRFGKPEDLLSTVFWLLSDASSFISGIVVPVDGGFSAFSGV